MRLQVGKFTVSMKQTALTSVIFCCNKIESINLLFVFKKRKFVMEEDAHFKKPRERKIPKAYIVV